ncbi:hypothetical protein MPSEU_001102000 [Mayamaea pseudoterrestris]|nr:hypothetical protein MPSEU_001102000 [Mayamaea pseudoterrestris]
MPTSYKNSFTASLRERLHLDRSRITEWAEHEKEHIDVLAERHRSQAMEKQASLDASMTQYLTLKMQADCKVQEAVQAQGTIEELQGQSEERSHEIAALEDKLNEHQTAMRELRLDLIDEKHAVQSARRGLEETQTSPNAELDIIQRHIKRFNFLGIDFESSENSVLRFIFTLIDPNNPEKEFWIKLTTNDEDDWVVTDYEPGLHEALVDECLNELNDVGDGLLQFVRSIRQLFVASINNKEEE